MIVISNATPLHYLIEIEVVHIFKGLFGAVIIPQAVSRELQHENTPRKVKEWIQTPPEWLEIRQADTTLFTPQKQIGKGEHETIALAIELSADAVLIDDRGARQEAMRTNLFIIPTLAILERAAKQLLIDLPEAIDRLSKTRFHLKPELYEQALERDRQWKNAQAREEQQ
jgi:predicted nucleic acid-binding protein